MFRISFSVFSLSVILSLNLNIQIASAVPILAVAQGSLKSTDEVSGALKVSLFTFSNSTYAASGTFKPFPKTFRGGVSVAIADTNGDFTQELIVGAGPGAIGPRVQIHSFSQGTITKKPTSKFFAFDEKFKGGVNISAGYFTPDLQQDLVFGAAKNSSQVKVFNVATNTTLLDFFAFDADYRGGVNVATGDFNGDSYSDIVVGAGPGGEPRVKIFNGLNGAQLQNSIGSFLAFESSFKGGVRVATGDLNGDGKLDIIAGGGPGGGPRVVAFSGVDGSVLKNFFAYDSKFKGGVQVTAGDVTGDGKSDIITTPGRSKTVLPIILFNSADGIQTTSFKPFGKKWIFGGVSSQF